MQRYSLASCVTYLSHSPRLVVLGCSDRLWRYDCTAGRRDSFCEGTESRRFLLEAYDITRRFNRQNGDCVIMYHVIYLGGLMPEGGVCRLISFQESKPDTNND